MQLERVELLLSLSHFTFYKFKSIFLQLSFLNTFLAIIEAQTFKLILSGNMPQDTPTKSWLRRSGLSLDNLKLTPRFLNNWSNYMWSADVQQEIC